MIPVLVPMIYEAARCAWSRGSILVILTAGALAGATGSGVEIEPGQRANSQFDAATTYMVHALYLVPSNRTAQADAVPKMQRMVRVAHDFYRDQMDRNGFGPKSFQYETEADGITPKVYVIHSTQTDAYFRADPWGRLKQAGIDAGLPVGSAGQAWMTLYEAHGMDPNGTITQTYATGGLFDSGSNTGGQCIVTGNTLSLITDSDILDESGWAGRIFPAIGPYPLVAGVSVAWFDGTTISQLSSVMHGVILHEFSHALGLGHNYRNDSISNGSMMGFGFRGVRGWLHPERFPQDYSRLDYGETLAWNQSRYFNPDRVWSEDVPPTVGIQVSGTVTPVTGLVRIPFTASDPSGLTLAWLQYDGNLVDEMPLNGTVALAGFNTPYFEPDTSNAYIVTVFDTQGNRHIEQFTVNVAAGTLRAPRPFIKALPVKVLTGEPIQLDASSTSDPDASAGKLQVEWDLDGDSQFEILPSVNLSHAIHYDTPGCRQVRARVTDSSGAQAVSGPIAICVTEPVRAAAGNWWKFMD